MITPSTFYGGAVEVSTAALVIRTHRRARVYRFNHTVASAYSCQLPTLDESIHEVPPPGGPLYYLVNDGTMAVVITRRAGGATEVLFNLTASKTAIIVFGNGDYRWTLHDMAT